jgi:hypothetical protein
MDEGKVSTIVRQKLGADIRYNVAGVVDGYHVRD